MISIGFIDSAYEMSSKHNSICLLAFHRYLRNSMARNERITCVSKNENINILGVMKRLLGWYSVSTVFQYDPRVDRFTNFNRNLEKRITTTLKERVTFPRLDLSGSDLIQLNETSSLPRNKRYLLNTRSRSEILIQSNLDCATTECKTSPT